MDLRFAAFDLITRDATLRALLVNYADRVEQGHAPDRTAPRFLALKWADNDRPEAPAGSQLLTARVHMPCHPSSERPFLDLVLARLQAALTVNAANALITSRCLRTSPAAVEDGDTIFKAKTFEVSPALPRRTAAAAPLELAPWTGSVHSADTSFVVPSAAAPSMN